MKTFKLKSDIEFEADDIDDAMVKLALYFASRIPGSEVDPYEVPVRGEIVVKKVEDGTLA